MDSPTDGRPPPPEASRPTSVLARYPVARTRPPRRPPPAAAGPTADGPTAAEPTAAEPAGAEPAGAAGAEPAPAEHARTQPAPNLAETPIIPPPKLRRRPALIALGITLVALGGLAAGWLTTVVGDTHAVLAMRNSVDRGSVVRAGDLTVARVNGDPALKTVPASARNQIVGKHAAVDLAAGALLTPGAVRDRTVPASGQSLVGVNLSPAQLPARPLRPGDAVRIVSTPRPQDDPPAAEPTTITGVVVGTRVLADTGRTVVDISVPSSDAAGLAAWAATGRVALVLDSGSP